MTYDSILPQIWPVTTVVGLGLIGGSVALRLKELGLTNQVLGVDANEEHGKIALDSAIIDEYVSLDEAISHSQLIIIATPVNSIPGILSNVLNKTDRQVIIDMGSTKAGICQSVLLHPARGRFVAAHPMWGTEFSGPAAATTQSFIGKAAIICEAEKSDPDALQSAIRIFSALGMHILTMNPEEHDLHTAYVSHLAHITSFALANTVLEKEKEEKAIFELASAGFESAVRLAKSNPDTWVPIFRENKDYLLDVLNEHMSQLRKFKSCLEKDNWDYLHELITESNQIKKVLDRQN
ncbi:MAG: prephenate dehydrogenase [Saprospiraceae bacterium]|nr:prephenate dehydrogenase [Saprospiraceae bacterium]